MNPFDTYKNKIGERLTKVLIDALEAGEISQKEASEVSSYILDNIDKAQDNSQLFDFLTTISNKWSIFSNVLASEQEEISNTKKEEAIGQASSLIEENKIDEAIKVVENATDQDQNKGGV